MCILCSSSSNTDTNDGSEEGDRVDVNGCMMIRGVTTPLNSTHITLKDCANLDSLTIRDEVTNLTIHGCTKLTWVDINTSNNIRDLELIDVSEYCISKLALDNMIHDYGKLHALRSLKLSSSWIDELSNTLPPLDLLDIESCSLLTHIPVTKINEAIVTQCDGMRHINAVNVTNLTIRRCRWLADITVSANTKRLSVFSCNRLLDITGQVNDLTDVIISGCPSLDTKFFLGIAGSLNADGKSKIKHLTIKDHPSLYYLTIPRTLCTLSLFRLRNLRTIVHQANPERQIINKGCPIESFIVTSSIITHPVLPVVEVPEDSTD